VQRVIFVKKSDKRKGPQCEISVGLGLVYFSGIFIPKRCGDMWGFGVHPIPSNPLPKKYSTMIESF
jgi:hypothetical protein